VRPGKATKTWAWETAIDQMRAECDEDEQSLRRDRPGGKREGSPRLVGVMALRIIEDGDHGDGRQG
jgi:hypothetical protein